MMRYQLDEIYILKAISTFFFLFLLATSVIAQKRLSQTYDISGIDELYIDSNEIFEIRIQAADTKVITVHTIIEGETFASTLLNTNVHNNTLQLTTGKTPDYVPFNDKLSAHKVMAIELEITVPEGLDISVYSTLASLDTSGSLGQLRVDLDRGHYVGKDLRFRESANINTISGSIMVEIAQAIVTAQSRNGAIVIAEGITGILPLKLQSLHGDITVIKSE